MCNTRDHKHEQQTEQVAKDPDIKIVLSLSNELSIHPPGFLDNLMPESNCASY